MTIEFITADCLDWMRTTERRFDLTFGNPPYCDARTYGIDAQRDCAEWVEWMLQVTEAAVRITTGPVIWVAAGVTRERNYWPACEGLMWEWWKRGGSMYRPCYWHRVGIPGSGGNDWFRFDVEYVMCFKHEGKLPWSDNTAMGHKPKWAPGGEMSNRTKDGGRVHRDKWGATNSNRGCNGRRADGTHKASGRKIDRQHTKRNADGTMTTQDYSVPVLANPGNLIHTKVGGGNLGSRLAHENEAPFPEKLVEFFIRSCCPPGGWVCEPFSGSGTTAAVCVRTGRNCVGIDVRASQTALAQRRCAQVQRELI